MPRAKLDIDLAKVEELASRGLSMEKIAYCLGVSPRTLERRKQDMAEVAEAIKKGQSKGERAVADKLYEAAMDGKAWAICFFLKCRGGWKETQSIDVTSSDGSMSPAKDDAFNLAMFTPEQLRALRGLADEKDGSN